MRRMNNMTRENVGFGFFFLIALVLMILAVANYIDVASNCNGIVVKDYMNMPVCINPNAVSIPVR